MAHVGTCRLCSAPLAPDTALAVGDVPPCNRFSDGPDAPRLPLAMVECAQCQLVQLLQLPPLDALVPRHAWIRYNEPSAHLPDVAQHVRALMPDAPGVLGLGPFEGPLLQHMTEWGGARHTPDLAAQSAAQPGRYPYLETWQHVLRHDVLASCGKADLVTCRYLLEHSHDPVAMLQALAGALKPGGVLLVEVPDSSKFLTVCDYSFIWEEHVCYFTEATLRALAARAGLAVRQCLRYPGTQEDALVLLLQAGAPGQAAPSGLGPSALFARYRAAWPGQRTHYQQWLGDMHAQGRRVAIFGAGHQAIMFIHALGLAQLVDIVLDDAPDKAGCRIPGTAIPIVPSSVLQAQDDIGLCLLALSAGAQQSVRARFDGWLQQGGVMQSIYPEPGHAVD
ncbi:class I SAM-dependent methyltransferase [Pseudoduganella ginsengisoli]|uniref:Methyltransferase domain-containing protein n=1 Tax=Pseudoduganella ginsengisoli TaxID=1462440 RepID=A0A6L6PZQ5_9BURK|nr:class I SAM-dependent methyltransferase [Pseudoduganella ginsengisoli]MTW02644.1 methyltransferase domain-containing protein [Pseudoduganella ginsengisoli]